MKKIWLVFFGLMCFLLAGCSNITVLNPKSATGKEQTYLIWLGLAVMSIVILVVFVLFTYFVIKYRYKSSHHNFLPKDIKGNLKLELTYTIIPVILLIILAVPTVKITMDHSPSTEALKGTEGTHIGVTARQYEWEFEYENEEKVTDILVVPEGESIILHLISEDVVHSFWVPELAGKVDLYPNKELTYEIKEPEEGTYQGKCAEFCGPQHVNMTFTVKVVSEGEYEDYLKSIETD